MATTENVRRALTMLQGLLVEMPPEKPSDIDTRRAALALVEASRLDLEQIQPVIDAACPTSEVRHLYEPRATEIDVDVAVTTTGRTLAVKVGGAARPGESDAELKARAIALSLDTVRETIDLYAAAGLTFGKAEASAR